jgi:hypothetical protein
MLAKERDMEYFAKLGSLATDLWKKHDFNESHFFEVATRALYEMPPHKSTSFEEITRAALIAESLPPQADLEALFGQPPLTVYSGREFRIEVLFWTGATPAIHEHAFSGAFHVLHGSSIHVGWEFVPESRVSGHLQYGRVALKKAEILRTGDTRSIRAGDEFIHTTFHLEVPTVSVVVRTTNEQEHMPQYTYLPPSICYDAHETVPLLWRKSQILAMLVKTGRVEEHDEMLRWLFDTSDTFAVFRYLYQANRLRDEAAFEDLLRAAAVRHETLVAKIAPVMASLRHQNQVTKLRNKVKDKDLRFFLALQITVPERETVLALLKQQYPEVDPVIRFSACLKQLSDADLLEEKLSDAWLLMLECLLRGLARRDQIAQTFAQKYAEETILEKWTKIENLAAAVRRFPLIRPLFEDQARWAVGPRSIAAMK